MKRLFRCKIGFHGWTWNNDDMEWECEYCKCVPKRLRNGDTRVWRGYLQEYREGKLIGNAMCVEGVSSGRWETIKYVGK